MALVFLDLAFALPRMAIDDDGLNNFLTRTEAQTKALQSRALEKGK
jgi:hypothetical protein